MAHRFMRIGPDPEDKPTQPVTREMLARIAGYYRPYRRKGALVVATVAVQAGLGVIPPLLTAAVVDRAILHHRGGLLNLLIATWILLQLLIGLVGVGLTYLNTTIGQSIVFDLRTRLYRSLRSQGMRFFTHARAGEMVSRLSSDVGGVEDVVATTASQTLSNLFVVVSTLIAMFLLDWRLTLVSLAILPLFIYPTRRVGARSDGSAASRTCRRSSRRRSASPARSSSRSSGATTTRSAVSPA
ncbi:MAG: ABC transporter ATP-binding protein [Actinobacteria bacterium]|nr:MAG: ABC transporter ATP-binding protein [Actinomycetota bacterium]